MLNKRLFVMDQAGTDTGTGGGSGSGGTLLTNKGSGGGDKNSSSGGENGSNGGNSQTGGQGSKDYAWHTLPEKWQETLPEDIRSEPLLKEFKDFPSMVKSLVHAQKSIGAEKIVLPGKNATPEDWNQVWKKLGMPAKDKYELKAPEGSQVSDEALGKLKDIALSKGILPGQLQEVLNFFGDSDKSSVAAKKGAQLQQEQNYIKAIKEEWGAKFDINLKLAQRALDTFGDENLIKELEASRLGSHPSILKAFAKMGETLAEDTVAGRGAGSGGVVMTPAEAQSKIVQIYGNMDHPLHKQGHAEHDNAVKEMEKLHQYAYPEVKE